MVWVLYIWSSETMSSLEIKRDQTIHRFPSYRNRYTIYKDHITLDDCKISLKIYSGRNSNSMSVKHQTDEIHDGMNLELYYQ